MPDAHKIARGLSEAQKQAVIDALCLLDLAAGEGLGICIGETDRWLWADDIIVRIVGEFGLDEIDPINSARRILQEGGDA
jgi:hypothetical protein